MEKDILNPELVWVENSCYRFCDASAWSHESKVLKPYQEEEYDPVDFVSEDESTQEQIEIVPVGKVQFKHSFHVNR